MTSWSTLWREFVEERANPLTHLTLAPLLTILAFPYDWAHQLRLQAYHQRWRTAKRLPCRVISVGNLTLGGTGKTPMVETISKLLQQEGLRVAILSRGYGGSARTNVIVVSDGKKCLVSPDVAGDEPLLLAEHLPGVPVIVGADRYAAGRLAIERFAVNVVILDDGFQHVPLARDLNLLLLDASRPFGNGRLFPRGDLRERPTALSRADAIVFTHWEAHHANPLAALTLSTPIPPFFYSQHEPIDVRMLANGQTLPLSSLNGRRVLAFCGIGAPESFRQTLHQLRETVVAFRAFRDHHPFTRSDLTRLIEEADHCDAEILVTTEKDGIRLRQYGPLPERLWEVRVRATILGCPDVWRASLIGNA